MTSTDDRRKLERARLGMAAKRNKPHKPAGAIPVTSAPYDPLDLRTLAASMAKVVLEQPVHPLAKVPVFEPLQVASRSSEHRALLANGDSIGSPLE